MTDSANGAIDTYADPQAAEQHFRRIQETGGDPESDLPWLVGYCNHLFERYRQTQRDLEKCREEMRSGRPC